MQSESTSDPSARPSRYPSVDLVQGASRQAETPPGEPHPSAEAILASIAEGIIVLSKDWRFIYVNRVAEEIAGATAQSLLNRDHWQVFPSTVGSELETMYRRAASQGRPAEITYYSKRLDKWLHVKAHPSEIGLTLCFTDITSQKHAQAKIEATEERFRLAAANRCITLYEQDRDLRYTWLYPVHPEHSHALGQSDDDFYPNGSAHELVELKRSVMTSGKEVRREIEVNLRSGVRHYDLFVSPRRDVHGVIIGVAGAALDITDRKRFEQALRRSEEQLRATYEHAPVGIGEADLEGRLVLVNTQFCSQLGYTREELIGKRFLDFTHPLDTAHSAANFQKLVDGTITDYWSEKRYIHKRGHFIWVSVNVCLIRDSQGKPQFGVAIAQDITHAKRSSEQQGLLYKLVATVNRAGETEEIYAAALDALCQSQATRRGAILLFNDAGVMKFVASRGLSTSYQNAAEGHSPWTSTERNPQPICIENVTTSAFPQPLSTALEQEGIHALAFLPLVFEKQLLGKFMVYFDQPHVFRDEDLRVAETIARQVSFAIERQRAANALEALVAERTASLQEAIHQMEEFSYTVSHDLRSPVRAIVSYADAIFEDHSTTLHPEVQDYLRRILRNAQRMDVLVRDTLAYSRVARRELTLAEVSLDKVVEDVIGAAEIQPGKARITVRAPLGQAFAHESSLGQAISNLLSNAIKFVPPNLTPEIVIHSENASDRIRLLIQDNGIGIHPDFQSRLFRIFERLHPERAYEGTGIGLAIVKKAIERMGGAIGVISDGVTGSTFWIELPTTLGAPAAHR